MSALRSLRQLAGVSRGVLRVSRLSSRSPAALPTRVLSVSAKPIASRAFSVSTRAHGEGASDVALASKINEELKFEKEGSDTSTPAFVTEFKKKGIWNINDTPGSDEVTLVRKFGSEEVRMIFSIADVQETDFDEMEEAEEGGEDAEPAEGSQVPIRVSFSFSKSTGPGALNIDTLVQDGAFVIDNVTYYKEAKLGHELTPEAEFKRRSLYMGPGFETLDVAVQEEFEKFIQERGIDESLALFIPEYAEWKEQQEYIRWLEGIKSWVDL